MFQNRGTSLLLIALSVVVLQVSTPSTTEAKSLWHLRAFGVWIEPDLDYRVPTSEDPVIFAKANGGFGLGISAEYQFSDRLGFELGVLRATPEIVLDYYLTVFDVSLTTTDDLAMTPISLGLNIHLLPKSRLDLYLSPFLAYVRNGDLEFNINETFEVDGQILRIQDSNRVTVASDVAYGASLGLDIPFSSKPWAIATSLRYMASELNAADPEGESISPDFNSWILTAGFRYTF